MKASTKNKLSLSTQKSLVILLFFLATIPLAMFFESSTLTSFLSPTAEAEPDESKNCRDFKSKFYTPYSELKKHLPAKFQINQGTLAAQITKLPTLDCQNANHLRLVNAALSNLLLQTPESITIFLPPKSTLQEGEKAVLQGLQLAFSDARPQLPAAVSYQTTEQTSGIVQSLAEEVFRKNVSIIIGGLNQEHAQALTFWAQRLSIPLLLLNDQLPDQVGINRFVFSIFPPLKELARAIAEIGKRRGYKAVAAMLPQQAHTARFQQYLNSAMLEKGLKVLDTALYVDSDYESLENAARKIFKLQTNERLDEYRDLLKSKKLLADLANLPFNPEMISLDPQINFDALIICDHFKNVKYTAKILKYLKVKSLPLLGNFQWRSPALLSPYEPFLDGASFLDFTGIYSSLPKPLQPSPIIDSFFTSPQEASATDMRLIGFRTGSIAAKALVNSKFNYKIMYQLEKTPEPNPQIFGSGTAFSPDHTARWPVHLFTLHRQSLSHQRVF